MEFNHPELLRKEREQPLVIRISAINHQGPRSGIETIQQINSTGDIKVSPGR